MTRCVAEPISWLRLERYALGEGTGEEPSAVAAHLAECAACRACFAQIEADAKRELPPLPAPTRGAFARRRGARILGAAAGAGLALAAATILGVGRFGGDGAGSSGGGRAKGDAVAFSLVRDDEQLIAEAGGTFHDRDRFKALVTCPPGMRARFDLVVFEEGGASFPLEAPGDFVCGNEVPLAGAFRVTGGRPLRVCLVWNEAPGDGSRAPPPAVDRAVLSRAADEAALSRAVCKVLQPAP